MTLSNSSGSASFHCPKCLTSISVRKNQAGTQVNCPTCGVSLTVPDNLVADSMFDDLFDDNDDANRDVEKSFSREDIPNTIHDESELDTGFIESFKFVAPADSSQQAVEQSEIEANDKNIDQSADSDPFGYDDNKPLRIDGISEDIHAPDSFYMRCPVCRSELQVNDNQIGQTIECSDCYSQIPVRKPAPKKKKKDVWRQPAELKKAKDSDELQLEPPVELPKIDSSMGLDDVKEDLLAPMRPSEDSEPVADTNKARSQNQKVDKNRKTKPRQNTGGQKQELPKVRATLAQPKNKKSKSKKEQETKQDFRWKKILELQWYQDLDLIIRTVVAIVFLSFTYAMVDHVWSISLREDLNSGEKFTQYFPSAFGAFVCFLVVSWFLAITFSVVMRSVANGEKKVEEWVGFAPSEWLGNFLVVLVSSWAALLPGVMLGFFLSKLTSVFFFLPLLAAVSAFALMPLFVISSFRNESPFNIFSPDIVQTFSSESKQWIDAYKIFAAILGLFFVGMLVLLIPGFLFCIAGAALQVIAVTVYSIFVGFLARGLVAS